MMRKAKNKASASKEAPRPRRALASQVAAGRAAPQPAAPATGDNGLMAQSVERAVRVLEAWGKAPRPLSLGEVSEVAGIDKSGAQRICHTLRALGYLDRDPRSGGLVPGKRLLDRSFDCLKLNPLVERATPVVIELRKAVPERVDLSLLDDTSIVYAVRLQSKRETFSATLIGRRLPVFCSSGGRAMLAAMNDAEVDESWAGPTFARSPRRPSPTCRRSGGRSARRAGPGTRSPSRRTCSGSW
jgi:DNA-binding IclR family transcriptional regulator